MSKSITQDIAYKQSLWLSLKSKCPDFSWEEGNCKEKNARNPRWIPSISDAAKLPSPVEKRGSIYLPDLNFPFQLMNLLFVKRSLMVHRFRFYYHHLNSRTDINKKSILKRLLFPFSHNSSQPLRYTIKEKQKRGSKATFKKRPPIIFSCPQPRRLRHHL